MNRSVRWSIALVVAAHTALLLAYTLPAGWVPLRVRYWSQAYARVLFHQDWRLFAPDPPDCGCSIEVQPVADGWKPLSKAHHHPIWRRMCANACRYAEASMHLGDTMVVAPVALTSSLERMATEFPRKGALPIRIERGCRSDPLGPVLLVPNR